jgi:hypothetical protein
MPNDKKAGRPHKWGEKKERREFKLTPTAYAWLKAQGGADFIEAMARIPKTPHCEIKKPLIVKLKNPSL